MDSVLSWFIDRPCDSNIDVNTDNEHAVRALSMFQSILLKYIFPKKISKQESCNMIIKMHSYYFIFAVGVMFIVVYIDAVQDHSINIFNHFSPVQYITDN